jgi:hypothetical protein
MKVAKIVGMVIGGLALAAGIAFLLGFVVQALWNWLLPDIFGLPEIGYWQAWGLLVLAHLLLGGGPRFHHSREKKSGSNDFREKMRKKFCARETGEEAGEAAIS